MSRKTWEINGLNLELDLENADCMERYENAFEEMKKEENEVPKDGKASMRIRAYCRLFRNLYDNIFGEGTIISTKPMANDTLLEIAFEKVGTKKIMANYAKIKKI